MKRKNSFKTFLYCTFTLFLITFLPLLFALLVISFWLVCILVIVATYHYYRHINKEYIVPNLADETMYVETSDNWNLALHYHKPYAPREDVYPVVLAHGLMANKYTVDLDEEHSIAYYLKTKGFHVFVVDLRGVGSSYHKSGKKVDFNFDDIVSKDVEAIISKVCNFTKKNKVSWIGHSMGGSIMQGYLSVDPQKNDFISNIIFVGVPGRLDHFPENHFRKRSLKFYGLFISVFNLQFFTRLMVPFDYFVPGPVKDFIFSIDNMDKSTTKKLVYNGFEHIAAGLAKQYYNWLDGGKETSSDGKLDYRLGLKNIRVPIFLLAGVNDEIATTENQMFALEKIQSEHKKLLIVSKENCCSVDHDHVSVLNGRKVKEEVFPLFLDWLETYGKIN